MKALLLKYIYKPFKKNRVVLISFFSFSFFLVLLLSIFCWICYQNKIVVNYTQPGSSLISKSSSLFITMGIPVRSDGVQNCWYQEAEDIWGSQYDIYIHNRSKYPFIDWKLEMTVPPESRIDSSWNGEYVQKEGKIIITGDKTAFTQDIAGENEVKLGFVLYTKELIQYSSFNLSGRFLREPKNERDFLICLSFVVLSFFVLVISYMLFVLVERQKQKDEEKIDNLLKLCAKFIDVRDEYTKMHSYNVAKYSKKIAEALGYDEDFQKNIYYMGMMHDVGKVLIPREILCKKAKLDDDEWKEMKKHTIYGANILEDFKAIPNILEAALYHHERYDGSGYPNGIKGEAIPVQARIIGVADSFDAMNTNRSYRLRLSDDQILSELENGKGTQFDPKVAEAMIELLKKNLL